MKHLLLALAGSSLLVACGSDNPAPADAAPSNLDASTDAPADVSVDAAPTPVMARTVAGPVMGVDRGGVKVFRRIPFAAPPVGPLRFAPPAPVTPWTAPLDGTVAGSECAQGGSLLGGGGASGTEDCLHVNVTTRGLTGSRPVMVWIHGGGFATGSGSEATYEATRLVTEADVVVVTINYRLGVFGFLSHPSLGASTATSGNWGFLDQQAALRWVRDNAANFGGDPARVTIFGESAGGTSVALHAVAPGSRGLFARAIVESGPCPQLPSRARADAIGDMAARAVGCTAGDVAACLRAAPVAALEMAVTGTNEPGGIFYQTRGFVYLPTFDGVTFTEQPLNTFRAGRGSDAPMIMGTNTDEGTLFTGGLLGPAVTTDAEYRAALVRGGTNFGFNATQAAMIADRYPASRYDSPADALTAVTTDGLFACSTRYVARLQQAAGHPVRLYRFDQEPGHVGIPGLGVFHASELSFVWGNGSRLLGDDSSAPALGVAMRGYWTRFAATADPGGTPAWPAWSPSADLRLRLAATIATEPGDADNRCAFWAGIYDSLM